MRRYIVAATPRSGSSLLCDGLLATGLAGRPAEVFAPDFRERWLRSWSLPAQVAFKDFLAAAIRHGTTDNAVYGLKIQWMHVAVVAAAQTPPVLPDGVLLRLFPDSKYVNIVRRDRLGQAVSWYRAIASNEWWRWQQAGEPLASLAAPPFDPDSVEKLAQDIARQQSAWEHYFSAHGIEPLTIEYEQLAGDYRGHVARVLAFLGLDGGRAALISGPRLARQTDDLSAQWIREIAAQHAGGA